ncbi:unnamed protein product, partial [Amoebophrya sp. A25]
SKGGDTSSISELRSSRRVVRQLVEEDATTQRRKAAPGASDGTVLRGKTMHVHPSADESVADASNPSSSGAPNVGISSPHTTTRQGQDYLQDNDV